MMVNLEESLDRILYRNDSGLIARELFDLLLCAVKPGFALDDALTLLYPKLDHCQESQGQYIAERSAVLNGAGNGSSAAVK